MTQDHSAASAYHYRFKIGDMQATMVSDGPLPVGSHERHYIKNLTHEEMGGILDANFVRRDQMVLEQNVLVLETGTHTILFDTGMGDLTAFGPTCGQLMHTLRAAGIDPNAIDAVVLSHAHLDHVSGIMNSGGGRNFPNAQYYITQVDFDFWTDPANPSDMRFDPPRRHLLPNRDRMVYIKDGEEFLPGVTAILAPGHTLGHMVFMVTSGNEQLCLMNDLAHCSVVMLERPRVHFSADTDPAMMADSRVRVLNMLADDKTRCLGYHFPWPGLGHIGRHADGFRFIPEPMQFIVVERV